MPLEVACATRILCKAGGRKRGTKAKALQMANSPVINRNPFAPNRTPVRSDSGSYTYIVDGKCGHRVVVVALPAANLRNWLRVVVNFLFIF